MVDQLEELKKTFDVEKQPRLEKLLTQLSRRRFKDAESLIRLHENLIYMLAYPQSKKLLDKVKAILASFPKRIEYLRRNDSSLPAFEDPEISGIASTSVTVMFGYKFALWLSEYHKNEAEISWEGYEEEAAIGAILPRILPLFEEEALVEAHLSFLNYIRRAKPKNAKDLEWLMGNFSRLGISHTQQAELYESLKLFIRFSPAFNSSRTGLKLDVRKIFYHDRPLIPNRDISLEKELGRATLKIKTVSSKEGFQILDIIRSASAVRYRELHGFIWCDEKSFLKVDLGRGVILYLNELLPENRLPLRAYHSGFIFKNGIPVGYVEGLSLFEKMEIGFNLYYTFRDGETAWLYARVLQVFKQHLGVTVFSVDPYQIGYENEEGIESGAFWFYRKLGFYPALDEVAEIVGREEKKISKRKDYRTPANILLKIAQSTLFYIYRSPDHMIRTEHRGLSNQWKDFRIPNILLAIQRRMSQRFNGNASRMREIYVKQASGVLNIDLKQLNKTEQEIFSNFALVLSLIPGFSKWTKEEKKLTAEIFQEKARGSEVNYLLLMQKHSRLRDVLIKIGSKGD